ncbi:MAG: stage V sporulation protein AD [Clostridia bacterium]|nr:stage V sporulation protein AD [Clostridia bacterium]
MPKRLGKRTIIFEKSPHICGWYSVVGKKEGEGPLGHCFDEVHEEATLGMGSFERAESELQRRAVLGALKKADLGPEDIDAVFAGDLLNQCIGSNFGLRDMEIPMVGLYGACSTMALALINAALYVDSGAAKNALAVTSSHFCSAERQYRFPLEYGSQRPQTSQWTVTGSGSAVIGEWGTVALTAACIGKICDLGVKDQNNMGAAMAPAAYDTVKAYLDDTKTTPDDYDMILTGDLGLVGSSLFCSLFARDGVDVTRRHRDCGMLIFDRDRQDVHSGGSGCGCSASVLCSKILNDMQNRNLSNILFCATGALLSPTSVQQGNSIPSIAHLINLRRV